MCCETEKLYYQDPFLTDFTAKVLDCQPGKKGFEVALDRTAFYPEGGGQPADHGRLNGLAVTDVYEKEGVIWHRTAAPLEVGAAVTGVIDWDRRFDHMQQHSGEHIISGILCHDYHCDNVGFHMGRDTVTIDYNVELTWEQIVAAERKANQVIWADVPCEIQFPARDELERIDYRSKKELTGQVRIVSFPGADCCACCGTHVRSAGQVGLVKVLSCQKFREGVRIEILCGRRALDYLDAVYEDDKAAAQALSVKPTTAFDAVGRMKEELAALKLKFTAAEEQLISLQAQAYAGQGDVLLFTDMEGDSLRKLADSVSRVSGGLAAVFQGSGSQYRYALERFEGDIAAEVKAMNAQLHGRGGGKKGLAQGRAEADENTIRTWFENR